MGVRFSASGMATAWLCRPGAADMIEGKLREKVGELAERNKVGVEAIRSEMHAPLANLRATLDAEVVARTKTDADDEALSQYLRHNNKWTDAKTAPSKNVVHHLRTIAKTIKKQP